jgi:hypothetical protein
MSLLQELGLEQMPDWIVGPRAAANLTRLPFVFLRDAIRRGDLPTIEPLPRRIQFVDLVAWFDALPVPRPHIPRRGRTEYLKQRTIQNLNHTRKYAHQLSQLAHNLGTLIRQPCVICGEAKSEAHHDDYLQPLIVRYLCRPHHRQFHTEQRHYAQFQAEQRSTRPRRRPTYPGLLNKYDAAELLGIPVRALRSQCWKRKLACIKLSQCTILYRRSDIERLLATKTTAPVEL